MEGNTGFLPDEKTPQIRTPSETLIRCLEDFGEAEPTKVIVLWTNTNGDICWSESGPSHYCQNIGMLTCVKEMYLKRFLAE